MKKILYSFMALSFLLPVITNAATFSISPSSGSFAPGDIITVSVFANPSAGEEITVAKLSASFATDMLEIISFSQGSDWMPLVAPGSDLIDNTNGSLIKTAGFPARLTASKQFGTIVLKAKSAGTAVISIKEDSMFLDITNANKFTASAGANFTIAAAPTPPVVKSKPVVTQEPVIDKTSETDDVQTTEGDTKEEMATSTDEVIKIVQEDQLAAVAESGTGSKTPWQYALAGFLLLLAAVLFWRRRESRS